jgi:hypothetical protein
VCPAGTAHSIPSLHAEASLQLQLWSGSKMTDSSNFHRIRETENGRSIHLFNAFSACYYVNNSVRFLRGKETDMFIERRHQLLIFFSLGLRGMKCACGALVDWYWRGKPKFSERNLSCRSHQPKCHMYSLRFNPGLHDKRRTFLRQLCFY